MKKLVTGILAIVLCFSLAAFPAMAASLWLEAEDSATLSNGASVVEITNASAGKAVSLGEATFNVSIDIADKYFVRVGCRKGTGNIVVVIDGTEYNLGSADAVYGTKWVVVNLSAGEHTVTYKVTGGTGIIDYLSVYNYSSIPMGSDSPSTGTYTNPYSNPSTSDSQAIWIVLASVAVLTAAGLAFAVKRSKN